MHSKLEINTISVPFVVGTVKPRAEIVLERRPIVQKEEDENWGDHKDYYKNKVEEFGKSLHS